MCKPCHQLDYRRSSEEVVWIEVLLHSLPCIKLWIGHVVQCNQWVTKGLMILNVAAAKHQVQPDGFQVAIHDPIQIWICHSKTSFTLKNCCCSRWLIGFKRPKSIYFPSLSCSWENSQAPFVCWLRETLVVKAMYNLLFLCIVIAMRPVYVVCKRNCTLSFQVVHELAGNDTLFLTNKWRWD